MEYTPTTGETVTVTIRDADGESLLDMTGDFVSDETDSFGLRKVTVANQYGNQWAQPTNGQTAEIKPVDNG